MVLTLVALLRFLSAVTKIEFVMIEVAHIILSAGSGVISEGNVVDNSAISGVIPRKNIYWTPKVVL